ncbi:MAG: MBOAT family protein [Bdellovibrionota bacterium]
MDLHYELIFILNFLVCFYAMKAVSWLMTPPMKRPPLGKFLFGNPYVSVRSLRIIAPSPATSPWLSFLLHFTLMVIIIVSIKQFLSPVSYFARILLGVSVYFFTETLGSIGQLVYSWKKENIYPIHNQPLTSTSLSEFWGRHWNLWVQDWIADVGRPFRRKHKQKIVASFLFSGIFHEAMVNLPHWIATGESYFGTMLSYFFIQGAGLYLDKKIIRHTHPALRRIFCWLVVILPAPLFIHMPVLRFFGMTE